MLDMLPTQMLAGNRLRQRAGEDDAAQQHEVVVRVTLRRRCVQFIQLVCAGVGQSHSPTYLVVGNGPCAGLLQQL